jgi:hypothetical protein
MTKTELIKGILEKADQLKTGCSIETVMIIDEMEKLIDTYSEQLALDKVSSRTWIVTIEFEDITENWIITAPNELSAKITASSNYSGKKFNVLRCVEYRC